MIVLNLKTVFKNSTHFPKMIAESGMLNFYNNS